MEQTKKMNVIDYLKQQGYTEEDYPTREAYETFEDDYFGAVFAAGYATDRQEGMTYEEALIAEFDLEEVCEATDDLPEGGFPEEENDDEE